MSPCHGVAAGSRVQTTRPGKIPLAMPIGELAGSVGTQIFLGLSAAELVLAGAVLFVVTASAAIRVPVLATAATADSLRKSRRFINTLKQPMALPRFCGLLRSA